MDNKELFNLFDEKTQELFKSNFSQNLLGSGVSIKCSKSEQFVQNFRKGPRFMMSIGAILKN